MIAPRLMLASAVPRSYSARGTHAQGQDAAGPAVGVGACLRRRTSGEEEPSWRGVVIDAAANRVPYRGQTLPLVEEKGAGAGVPERRIGFNECTLAGVVQEP